MEQEQDTTEPEGPYFNFTARAEYLNHERNQFAQLAADYVLKVGEIKKARYFAKKYAAADAAVARLWERHDLVQHSPDRWIGYSAFVGYESGAWRRAVLGITTTTTTEE